MQRYSFKVQYKGNKHCGWASARNSRSRGVVDALEEGLKRSTNGLPPVVAGAGRTDARVNATGQHAHVDVLRQSKNKYINPKGVKSLISCDSSKSTLSIISSTTTPPSAPHDNFLVENEQSLDTALDAFLLSQRRTKSLNPPVIFPSLLPSQEFYTFSRDLFTHEPSENTAFINELKFLTTSLEIFMNLNKDITYSKPTESHNNNISLFISSAFALSCIKNEFKPLYQNQTISHSLLTHPSLQYPITLPTFSEQSLLPKDHATIVTKKGANLLQLQLPMTPKELNIFWNQSLHGDFGVPGAKEARSKQRQIKYGNSNQNFVQGENGRKDQNDPNDRKITKPTKSIPPLSQLISQDSESDDVWYGDYEKPSQEDTLRKKHKIKPPTVFGSIAVSHVKAPAPLYLPFFNSLQFNQETAQDEKNPNPNHILFSTSSYDEFPTTSPHTQHQNDSHIPPNPALSIPKNNNPQTHPYDHLSCHFFPTYRRPRHARYDAWKRQYKYRIHFNPIPYDPFDHSIAAHIEHSSKLCPPFPPSLPHIHTMTDIEQHLYTLYRNNATEHHNNPATIMTYKENKHNFNYHAAYKVAKILTGKHNYNAFRNSKCQAISPIRRVDDITFSFEPTMSQLISNGLSLVDCGSYNSELDQYCTPTLFLSTSSLKSAQEQGFKPTFSSSCRCAIADIISLLIRRRHQIDGELVVPDPLLQTGAHYEDMLQDLNCVEQLFYSPQNAVYFSPAELELLVDILYTTQPLHELTLNDWRQEEENEKAIIDNFIRTQVKVDEIERDVFTIQYTARAYLHNQVRIMTGAILKAGRGELLPHQVQQYLDGASMPQSPSQSQSPMLTSDTFPNENVSSSLLNNDIQSTGDGDDYLTSNKTSKLHPSTPSSFTLTSLITGEQRVNNEAKTAPASGLFFTHVHYPTDHNDFVTDSPLFQRNLSHASVDNLVINSSINVNEQNYSPLSAASFQSFPISPQFPLSNQLKNPHPHLHTPTNPNLHQQHPQRQQFYRKRSNKFDTVSSLFGPEHNLSIWRKLIGIQTRFASNINASGNNVERRNE